MAGSFTVEAAYIVPLLCCLVYALLTLLFHLYNSVITYQASYVSAMRVAQAREVDAQIQYGMVETELESVIGTRLLAAELKRKIEVTTGEIGMEYEVNTYLLQNLSVNASSGKIVYAKQDPAQWIRYVRAVLDWKETLESASEEADSQIENVLKEEDK